MSEWVSASTNLRAVHILLGGWARGRATKLTGLPEKRHALELAAAQLSVHRPPCSVGAALDTQEDPVVAVSS